MDTEFELLASLVVSAPPFKAGDHKFKSIEGQLDFTIRVRTIVPYLKKINKKLKLRLQNVE